MIFARANICYTSSRVIVVLLFLCLKESEIKSDLLNLAFSFRAYQQRVSRTGLSVTLLL